VKLFTSRDYFFLYNWTWYHWVGMLAPLADPVLFLEAPPARKPCLHFRV